ncbi:MAG: hypothetical protein V4678_03270 [Patescibacteria group bacterium]
MDRKRFSEAYDRKPSAAFFHSLGSEAISNAIKPFDEWTEYLGDTLHESLRGESREAVDAKSFLLQYNTHILQDSAGPARASISRAILETEREDVHDLAAKAMSSHNFHVMSQSIAPLWVELIGGLEIGPADREKIIRLGILGLACTSLDYALWRQDLASIQQDHSFFSEEQRTYRETANGVMTEIDAAIVLLEMARTNRDLSVVPAPRRFEHADHATNADFIMYDRSTDEATGIQVKTKVTDEHRQSYDPERIVLICGGEDLGGRIWTRTKQGSSNNEYVAWPGMIAADVLKNIPLHGQKHTGNEHFDQKSLLNLRLRASSLLRPAYDDRKIIRGSLRDSRRKVEARVMPYLRQRIGSELVDEVS